MPYKDKEKQREFVRNHYKNNKDKYYLKNLKNKKTNKDWFENYIKDKSCSCCGESERCTLDFHHLNPSKKENNVANMVGQTYSIETLEKEISKCIILCANCHRKVHAGILQV